MNFYTRYELDKLIATGEANSFRAHEITTGRPVLLHMLGGSAGPAKTAELLEKVRRIEQSTPTEGPKRILEAGEFSGSPYVVTEAVEPFGSLREWLDSVLAGKAGRAPVAVPPVVAEPRAPQEAPEKAAAEPGEFTRLFQASPVTPAKPAASAAAAKAEEPGEFTRLFMKPPAPAAQPPGPEAPPKAEEPSEFTRLFQRSPTPAAMPPVSAGAEQAQQAGEFTRMFQTPPGPVERRPPERPQDTGEAGEFTQLFQTPVRPGQLTSEEIERAPAHQVNVPRGKPFRPAGEFTQMFGPSAPSGPDAPAPAPPGPPSHQSGSATGLFGTPAAAEPPVQEGEAKPGQYTMMMERAAPAEAQPRPAPPRPKVASTEPRFIERKRRRWLPWVLIGATVVVIVILLAIYLASK